MSMSHFFYRLHLTGVPAESENDLILFLTQKGASGSSESLLFSQPDLTFEPRIFKHKKKNLDVFFEKEPEKSLISLILEEFSIGGAQVFKEEEKDWLAEWKKGYQPFLLTPPFWIVPSWLESPVAPEYTIKIDPGMAFGTGTHATTQMAAHLVKEFFKKEISTTHDREFTIPHSNLVTPNKKTLQNNFHSHSHGNSSDNSNKISEKNSHNHSLNILDVGTGTGILSILSSKLGAPQVTAIDIDPECLRVASENTFLNNCPSVTVDSKDLDQIKDSFHLVIANIIDGVLIKLAPHLVRVTHNRGCLVLSGILKEHEDSFLEDFIEKHSLQILLRLEKDGWIGFLVRKNHNELQLLS
jgi:ribosomal protein L11 methyltransferase